jgi:hypothetical protein
LKFSELYGAQCGADDDWFDPILSLDTRLFLDPFLLYSSETGAFEGSHREIIAFFNSIFKLLARSQGNREGVRWRKAVDTLRLAEVAEICLGYTSAGTKGSGSGTILARSVAEAIWEAIQAGQEEITHFEEVAILREGIGADRISDVTAAIVRWRLAKYTAGVCRRHDIPVRDFKFLRGRYSVLAERWEPLSTKLPANTYNNLGILLVPHKYLRELPTVNAEDFWDYSFVNENETLRNEVSYDIASRVSKQEIVEFARRHPEIRSRYLHYREETPPDPYNLSRDPKGLYKWYQASQRFVSTHPVTLSVETKQDFIEAVRQMTEQYRHFVEENRGWRLLWNDNKTPRREIAAQDLFLGIVKHYCKANDIDLSREADIGRGPVDFKVSKGYALRALLEVKLAKNNKFWNGLERQLPTYQRAEEIDVGFFIVILFSDKDRKRLEAIDRHLQSVKAKITYNVQTVIVDARANPSSASRL